MIRISFIFSEFLFAELEYPDADADEDVPDVDPHPRDDVDDDNEEVEPNSGVLAHVELARSVREFGLNSQSRCPDSNLVCQNAKPLSQISHFKSINLPFQILFDVSYMISNILTVHSHQLMCLCMHVHFSLA